MPDILVGKHPSLATFLLVTLSVATFGVATASMAEHPKVLTSETNHNAVSERGITNPNILWLVSIRPLPKRYVSISTGSAGFFSGPIDMDSYSGLGPTTYPYALARAEEKSGRACGYR